jgi:diguanylate cyclase (GGDEF)-like protein
LLLASTGLGAASGALYVIPGPQPDLVWTTALLIRYGLFTVGLILLLGVRKAQSASEAILDGGIVAAGLAIVAWTFLVQPSLNGQPPGARNLGIAVTVTALDVLMLASLVRIMFGVRSPSIILVAGAGATVLAADLAVATKMASVGLVGFQPGHLIHVAWQLCGVLVAAATLHPSFDVGYPSPEPATATRRRALPRPRLSIFMVMAFIAPAVPVIGLVTSGRFGRPYVLPALAGSAALTGLLLVLLVVRLGLVARLATRRARAMDTQTAELAARAEALRLALDEQQTLQQELAHRATHDSLTGLANRALFAERLEKAVLDHTEGTGALLLLDLDNFKDVNDTLGHQVGDELLIEVATRLALVVAERDLVARLGGDEFALLLGDSDADRCRRAADRAVDALRQVYSLAGRQVHVAASGGLLLLGPARAEISDALRDADLALYAAKDGGKNRVVEFSPHMRQTRMRYAKMAAGLHTALADDALTVLYQPIVDLGSGRPVALEALLRWQSMDGTPVPPREFIPITEDIGLIVEIGAHVLTTACTEVRPWHDRYGVAVSVNVSGRQLAEIGFADRVLEVVATTAIAPQALILEVTETVLVGAGGATRDRVLADLNRLRERGIRIAVDDFGTGYSSLSYLDRLPIDILKIDQTFTQNLAEEGDRGSMLVAAILRLGASLSVPTIAEGVETPGQRSLLHKLGCQFAQGYHFSTPRRAGDVAAYLAVAPGTVGPHELVGDTWWPRAN